MLAQGVLPLKNGVLGGVPLLQIKSKYVEYGMSFDTDGNIFLKYPGMDQNLVLKY